MGSVIPGPGLIDQKMKLSPLMAALRAVSEYSKKSETPATQKESTALDAVEKSAKNA